MIRRSAVAVSTLALAAIPLLVSESHGQQSTDDITPPAATATPSAGGAENSEPESTAEQSGDATALPDVEVIQRAEEPRAAPPAPIRRNAAAQETYQPAPRRPRNRQRRAAQPQPQPQAAAASSQQIDDFETETAPDAPMSFVTPDAALGISRARQVNDYVATDSAFGTKTDTPLKETPQSVSVAGKEQIRDQGAQSLQETTRYVPGVFSDPYGFDARGDSSIIRGIVGSYFVDGLRQTYGYTQTTAPIEPYALERIEVLRGPASMLYGQAPTGGIINAVSKLPSDIAYREIGVEYGSFDFKQVKFDATGPLTSDGKWLYRVVGLARDAETKVDYVDNDRLMIAPSLTYRPTNKTSITVLGNYRNDGAGSTQQFFPAEGTLYRNTVTGRRIGRSTFGGEPNDHYDTESKSASLMIDHEFANGLKLHHGSRYVDTHNEYDSTYAAVLTPSRIQIIGGALAGALVPGGLPPGMSLLNGSNVPFLDANHEEVARARTATKTDTKIFNTDTHLRGEFATGALQHRVLGGVDYMRYQTDQLNANTIIDNLITPNGLNPALAGFAFQPPFNIYNPTYGQSTYQISLTSGLIRPGDPPYAARPQEVQQQTGIYIQDQLKIGNWGAVLGLRHDWVVAEQDGSPDETHSATTGRAALMYNFDFGLTPYVSYSTSFTPQPGQPVGSNIYTTFTQGAGALRPAGPIKGEQVEVGFKYQPKGAPFAVNASVYELYDRNQIVQPDVLFDGVQGADVKARGFEFEAVGKVTEEIRVIGSYSYTDAVYDKYPEFCAPPLCPFASSISDYMEGKNVDGVPQHLASLWAIYAVQDGPLRGLSFGGGVRYVGAAESYGLDVATGQELYVKTPSFTLFDAMIAYETPEWRWHLTAQNLEDEYVITSCAAYRGDCFIGQSRTLITGFTYRF